MISFFKVFAIVSSMFLVIGCNNNSNINNCEIDFEYSLNYIEEKIHYRIKNVMSNEDDFQKIKDTKTTIGSINIYHFNDFFDLPLFLFIDSRCNHFINMVITEEEENSKIILNSIHYTKFDSKEYFLKEFIKLRFFQSSYFERYFHLENHILSTFLMTRNNIFEIVDSTSLSTFEMYLNGGEGIFDVFSNFKDPDTLFIKYFNDKTNHYVYNYYTEYIKDFFLSEITLSIKDDKITYFYTLPDLKLYKFTNLSNNDSLNFEFEQLGHEVYRYYYFDWNASYKGEPLFYTTK